MHGEQRVGGSDLEQPQNPGVIRDERDCPARGLGGAGPLDEHTESRRVEERAAREIDDGATPEIRPLEGLFELRARRQVQLSFDPHNRRTAVWRRFDMHLDVAGPCHGRECR